jgi:hypothetical protein
VSSKKLHMQRTENKRLMLDGLAGGADVAFFGMPATCRRRGAHTCRQEPSARMRHPSHTSFPRKRESSSQADVGPRLRGDDAVNFNPMGGPQAQVRSHALKSGTEEIRLTQQGQRGRRALRRKRGSSEATSMVGDW